ncbi:uncharacterized protein JN550_001004 [Neoarthrinium moseri]|uniref:uncharacterized protein n=1 Tax=Neoarthrinium moseri TaxID=1658444 RepID=UPI001FDB77F6|nr:uncharacterized protein JN550_001004 [Neoarthrinium moseri]KAI1876932.1 hypothetical protein JN550_001004 [Neoarthrinium moseri]
MNFHLRYMADAARKQVNYISLDEMPIGLWNEQEKGEEGERRFEQLMRYLLAENPNLFYRIKSNAWTIWPINTGNHWMVIILRMASNFRKKGSQTVAAAAILEPGHGLNWIKDVWRRVRRLLSCAGFTVRIQARRDVWFPAQRDHFSCGLRAVDLMRVFLQRIESALLLGNGDEHVWENFSGNLQPDKVRALMIGICAVEAMRFIHCGSARTRVGLLPCLKVRGFIDFHTNADKVHRPMLEPYQEPPPPGGSRTKREAPVAIEKNPLLEQIEDELARQKEAEGRPRKKPRRGDGPVSMRTRSKSKRSELVREFG